MQGVSVELRGKEAARAVAGERAERLVSMRTTGRFDRLTYSRDHSPMRRPERR
jgi:hypothetical protein